MPFLRLLAVLQFYLIFNNFAKNVMNRIDLSYQILTGEESKLLVDENLIKTAQWLEKQGIVDCVQKDDGISIRFKLEGIDAWLRSKLSKINIDWTAQEPCVYGIALPSKTSTRLIKNGKTQFAIVYESLWIQTAEFVRSPEISDTVVHFADIFCEKINFRQLVERVASNKDIAFVLKWEKEELFLNEQVIVTARASMRKAIMQILIERQKNDQDYTSFEEIANILQEQYEFVIDDIHSQIYRHIRVLQQRVQENVPQFTQRGDFIEVRNNCCRLNPSIWVMD
jgi:hypothetical protein